MTDENKKTIGLVGIGRMGLAITKHLTHHGYKTIVNDLDARQCEAAARDHGSRVAGTPAEVGAAARFVIIAVGFDDEATQVVLGPGGLIETMPAGSIVAVSSTCTPDHVKWLAKELAVKGILLADAPICRGAKAADDGTMRGAPPPVKTLPAIIPICATGVAYRTRQTITRHAAFF